MKITAQFLLEAVRGCSRTAADTFAPAIEHAALAAKINTPERLATFLAHTGHESGGFISLVESFNYTPDRLLDVFGPKRITKDEANAYGRTTERAANQERLANILYGGYWGAKNLGNTQEGDGWKYRGRGLLQITGRANYRNVTELVRALFPGAPDFEVTPSAVEQVTWAVACSAAWWKNRGCNELADIEDFDKQTQRINGGLNGLQDRKDRLEIARKAVSRYAGELFPAPLPSPSPTPAPETGLPAGESLGWPFGDTNRGQAPQTPVAPPPVGVDVDVPVGEAERTTMDPLTMWGLAKTVIGLFSPLAQEKIEKEVGRHSDNPAVVAQITTAVMDKLQEATKQPTALSAVAAVTDPRTSTPPEVIRVVEQATLAKLEELTPMFELLHKQDLEARAVDEQSRDAASKRAQAEGWDMSRLLVLGAFWMIGGLAFFVCIIAVVQAIRGDGTIKPEVWAQVAGLIGFATGVGTTIYAYRFGTSRSSAAKDVMIREITARGPRRNGGE
jgi:putative chitinase